ncbi:MFS transporter [candidate division KSB1 bacterium]
MEEEKGLLKSFPGTYWVAILLELFERGAYYGLNAVLAFYLVLEVVNGGMGFSEAQVGFLQGWVYVLTYVVPIIGGALAERYGYRRMLMFAFSLLSLGYFVSGHVSTYGIVFASLLVMATGSGLFKPIITGTVARTTTKETSAFGFGVYYWAINLGALIAPAVVIYISGFSWSYVFIASSAYCALMLIPVIFFYKEPPKPKTSKTLGQSVTEMLMVLSDFRFMLMIVIYSTFWILYFQMFNTVIWYSMDFVDMTKVNSVLTSFVQIFSKDATLEWNPAMVTMVNAGTIVLLQVFVSKIVKNLKAFPVMVFGVLIGTLGFVFLAVFEDPWMFVLGIAVFSIGEMTAHPKYYSYIGLVAPKDKVAVYMGYAFLYGIIGSLVGSNLGANLYTYFVETHNKPRLLWVTFSVLGFCSAMGLILYNKFIAPKEAAE